MGDVLSFDDVAELEESRCVAVDRPVDAEECNMRPCEGAEWIVSDWSGVSGGWTIQRDNQAASLCSGEIQLPLCHTFL